MRLSRRMRRATRFRLVFVLASLTLLAAAVIGFAVAGEPGALPEVRPEVQAQASVPELGPGRAPLPGPELERDPRLGLELDPDKFEKEGDHYVQRLEDGRVVHLTLDVDVQAAVQRQMRQRKVPHGGLVAVEPSTGRVLAMVSESHAGKRIEHYALKAEAPSASVFKLVTAAALLERTRIDPNRPVCYSGGLRSLDENDIRGNPVTDNRCATLDRALAESINSVMARLAFYNLTREDLEETAARFGFNREIPFELPVEVSEATFVEDNLERARTAAGFWNVNLSPLHGALIAAAFANEGVIMRPTLVDRIEKAGGEVEWSFEPEPWLTAMSAEKAHQIAEMAEGTTSDGTAKKAFQGRKDWPKELKVTGKTGTLSNKRPFYTFTWFVGSAPLDNPEIAVGALIANKPKWWIKGMHAAATAILSYHKKLH